MLGRGADLGDIGHAEPGRERATARMRDLPRERTDNHLTECDQTAERDSVSPQHVVAHLLRYPRPWSLRPSVGAVRTVEGEAHPLPRHPQAYGDARQQLVGAHLPVLEHDVGDLRLALPGAARDPPLADPDLREQPVDGADVLDCEDGAHIGSMPDSRVRGAVRLQALPPARRHRAALPALTGGIAAPQDEVAQASAPSFRSVGG